MIAIFFSILIGFNLLLLALLYYWFRRYQSGERARVEAALRDSNNRLRAIFDTEPECVKLVAADGTLLEINAAGFAIMEVERAEAIIGKSVYPLIVPEYKAAFEALNQSVCQGNKGSLEFEIITYKGKRRWLETRAVPLRNGEDGAFVQLAITRDITEYKRAEEELRRQNLRSQLFAEITLKIRQSLQLEEILQTTVTEVQTLLQADRVLIFRLAGDGSGNVVQEAVLPDLPVVLGQNIVDPCFQTDYKEQYRQGRISAITNIETAGIHECHQQLLKSFGVKANLVVPILIRENLWGLLIAHQCTHPRQWSNFETELLSQIADQIGIALTQAELLEQETNQRQELARSNQELEQFAYVASHDLQEPLRMVTSYLQLIERRYKDKLDENADEFIAYAVDGATRMQALINDLLSYSRVNRRGQPFTTVNTSGVLQTTLANLRMLIAETGATLTYDTLPELIADQIQLTQLFQNLIGNAIKFRRKDVPPCIHVGVARGDGDKGEQTVEKHHVPSGLIPSHDWLFWVQDNGIGIEPEYSDRIFLIFQRLHRRGKYPGTGIGLAICKKIVERHGGRIWVESQPGQGSIFYFTIPQRAGT